MKYLICVILVVSAVLCFAGLPQTMSYQGVLTDNNGDPVADGSYTVGFGIHNSPGTRNDGTRTQLWSETQTITVTNGQFRAVLGSVNPLNLPFDVPYWLAITVNGSTLSPYSELTSVPFSFYSRNSTNADSLNGQPGSYYNNWSNLNNVPSGFADGTDNVGSILYDAVVATSGGDYTSLQDAVAAGKKTIYVRKGNYTNTPVLNLPADAVIIGESWTETVISGYTIQGAGRVTMKNIKITCNSGSMNSLNFSSGENCIFDDVWIENSRNVAISVGNNSIIRNCYISCVFGIQTGQKCTVENNIIIGTTQNCSFGDQSKIFNNRFQASSGSTSGSIQAYSKCIISGNILVNSSTVSTGIYAGSGSIVSDNRIEGFLTGISLSASQDGIICSNNIVKSCGGNAFSVSSPTNSDYGPITLSGNIAWQPGGIGFRLEPASHVYLSNNSVYNASSDGFYINTGVNIELQLNGNSARYCLGKGFNCTGGSWMHQNWNINNNQAIGNSSDGFCMFAQDASISGNISMSNSGVGYNFPNALQYSSFTGNSASYNGSYGFYASGSPALTYVTITGNVIRENFYINGQNHYSAITGNVLTGGANYFGSPQTNAVVSNNVQ